MIPRYSRNEMSWIWSPENRYQRWLDIEILACEAKADLWQIPQEALKNIKTRAAIDIARIEEIENITKHDVIAFVTSVAEKVGEDGRFIHMGEWATLAESIASLSFNIDRNNWGCAASHAS